MPHTLHPYEHDPSTASYGLEAAEVLGIEPARVFKTLLAEVEGRTVVAVVPVSGMLDLKALAAAVGGKRAVLADAAVAERLTGYVVGGISPLGQRRRLPTVVDETALGFGTVFGFRLGFDVALAPEDLFQLTTATTAAIGRRD